MYSTKDNNNTNYAKHNYVDKSDTLYKRKTKFKKNTTTTNLLNQ